MVKRCTQTLDLFDIPRAAPLRPGALDFDREMRALISAVLKSSPLSRELVAGRMSELLGDAVSVHQLNAWSAESREAWRFPLSYLPALEAACETHALTEWIAEKRGCALLVGEDSLLAELGRLDEMERHIKSRRTAIRNRIGKAKQ